MAVLLITALLCGAAAVYAEGTADAAASDSTAKTEVGSIVSFGRYEQDNNKENGPEPIEWIVLDTDGEKALLLSRYGLDTIQYNQRYVAVTWETCTLRSWLNNEFLSSAFSEEEQSAILLTDVDNSAEQGYYGRDGGNNTQDKVFLLSYAEANKYLGVTYNSNDNVQARVTPTAYALARGAWTKKGYKTPEGADAGRWWLRSPGRHSHRASHVYGTGAGRDNQATAHSPLFGYDLVRPVVWVNLEADIF